jgi:1,4-alpha-glucan branching enzyme
MLYMGQELGELRQWQRFSGENAAPRFFDYHALEQP